MLPCLRDHDGTWHKLVMGEEEIFERINEGEKREWRERREKGEQFPIPRT
jgi:hypothetical protein